MGKTFSNKPSRSAIEVVLVQGSFWFMTAALTAVCFTGAWSAVGRLMGQ